MSLLFEPLKVGEITFRNRIFVSPMCQYSASDGLPGDWHLVHLGSRAVGGAGLVMVEASAVVPEGRITPGDTGLWSDAHAAAFHRITQFMRAHGAVPGIQLAHAGRKASMDLPWRGGKPLLPEADAWTAVAPSAVPFAEGCPAPRALGRAELDGVVAAFAAAARRAQEAGFECIELHMAHGFLLHEFLSPLANRRDDDYGGSLENRMRLPLRVAEAVRAAWPARLPLFARISVSDWAEGGWDIEQSVTLCRRLQALGVDLIDCSSGGMIADPRISVPVGPGFQAPFAGHIRREAGIKTAAVGLITEAVQAEHLLCTGQADAVFLGREMLRDPYWPLHAAAKLRVDVPWPQQYLGAKA